MATTGLVLSALSVGRWATLTCAQSFLMKLLGVRKGIPFKHLDKHFSWMSVVKYCKMSVIVFIWK